MTDLAMDYAQDVAPKVPSMRWADLTPPPAEDKNYKVEVTIEDPTPQTTPTSTAINGFLLPKSNPTSRTGSPNPRKTIKWHGRNVVIQIPSETSFGVPGGRPMPLNKLQVEERMREWIERGYSIEIGGQGASRDVYPEERKEKVEASDIFVSIPDRREWEAYVNTLREEKLRALGVILDDPPPSSGGDTPLSHLHSPALRSINPFSPPPQSTSAMSNPHSGHPHGPFNPFSPVSIPVGGTPGPIQSPGLGQNQFSFHLPRQSLSSTGTPAHVGDWDPYAAMFAPPIQQPTPPNMGPGVWSPPYGMRNGSPGIMNMPMHGQSPNQFNTGYPMDNHLDPYSSHHGLVGQERFHQQQVRRGSPLAIVRHPIPMEIERREMPSFPSPAIDAPVPKHRHQLSVTLQQEFENLEAYREESHNSEDNAKDTDSGGFATNPVSPAYLEESRNSEDNAKDTDSGGFATNPVSPVPLILYPDQPAMPSVETDIHIGPELASNPDDDDVCSDIEAEKLKNVQEATAREITMNYPYIADLQMPDGPKALPQQFIPQSQYGPHSREQSLSQMQHEFDIADPVDNSAMSMLMAGEGLGSGINDVCLSEDGRTNDSEITTNPSEPSSPVGKFSSTTSHAHQISNSSNVWAAEHTKNSSSTTSTTSKPKFNVNAAEFKFDPSASFTFAPKSNSFSPTSQMVSPDGSQDHSFGGFGAGFTASGFRPNLTNTGVYTPIFDNGAAAFSPSAPAFTPSLTNSGLPPPIGSIFGDIIKPPPIKKIIPIVRPPSTHEESAAEKTTNDRREATSELDCKRVKRSPTPTEKHEVEPSVTDTLSIAQSEDDAGGSSDEEEQLMNAPFDELLGTPFAPFEFPSRQEAEDFANAVVMDGSGQRESRIMDLGDRDILSPEEASLADIAHTTRESSPVPGQDDSDHVPKAAQEFNFEFPNTSTPPKKVVIPEVRYSHSPSPPPSEPAPPPPSMPEIKNYVARQASPFGNNSEPSKSRTSFRLPKGRIVPSDAELDEVIKYMDKTDTANVDKSSGPTQRTEDSGKDDSVSRVSLEEPEGQSPWRPDSPSGMDIPLFEDHIQRIRSAGPSPSPRRAEQAFIHHRPSSFSPDIPHAISDYNSNGLLAANDDDSDWNDMISESGGKLRPQSRLFFDAHVEELVGGLFQSRLDPVLHALNAINETLNSAPSVQPTRSLAEYEPSDADDEDEVRSTAPVRSPRDKRLEKIKSALAEVLMSQRGEETPISEQSLKEIKDAVVANGNSREFAEVRAQIADVLANASRHEDMSVVRAVLEDVSLTVAQSSELAELKDAVLEAIEKTVYVQEEIMRCTAKTEDLSTARDAARDDVSAMRDTVRDAVDEIVTTVCDRVDDSKFALQDIVARGAQRSDIADIKSIVTSSMASTARKEDLVPIHNVLAEAFEKSAKTEDLLELNGVMINIMNSMQSLDPRPTYQEVLKLKQENDRFNAMLHEVLRVTQDSAANSDFNLEAQAEAIKGGHDNIAARITDVYSAVKGSHDAVASRVTDVHSAVKEVTKLVQTSFSKNDMRRNLSEKEQKEDSAAIKNAINDTTIHVQEGLRELGRTQPTLEDFKFVAESVTLARLNVEELRTAMVEATAGVPRLADIQRGISEVIGLDELKVAVNDVAAVLPRLEDIRRAVVDIVKAESGVEEIRKVVEEDRQRSSEEIHAAVQQVSMAQPSLQDFRELMEDVISKQQLFVPVNFENQEDEESKREAAIRIESLERSLAQVEKRGEAEATRSKEWQERAVELEARLKLAEEEAARQTERAEEKDRRLKASDDKRQQTLTSQQMRSALLEGAHSSLQKSNGVLSVRNAELEGIVREAQASEEKHRGWNLKLEEENKEMLRAVERMKVEMEESIKVRESFRTKFDRMQEDMRRVSTEIGQDQGEWRHTQEEQKARIEVLDAKLAAEVAKREGLEAEVQRLEVEEKEAIRLRVGSDQLQRAVGKAEELITQLKQESLENQSRITQLSFEVEQAREATKDEVKRVTFDFEKALADADTETNLIRDALEKEVERVQQEATQDAEDAVAENKKLRLQLEEAKEAKTAALRQAEQDKTKALKEAAESRQATIQDLRRKQERQLEDLRVQSERAYQIATEDAERDQYFLQKRLDMSDEDTKNLRSHIESLQAQVKTLNENFKVANVAAQAAAQAATTVREMTAPQISDDRALRESVHVLQTQLQERESRIDELESELDDINVLRTKTREAEGQLSMYRELLDLRIDDLEEIIHTCGLAHLDRGSLKDAATRLKASLEMQLHEKERAMGITKPEDKLTAVQNAAAKLPGVASGVASAAWQTWKNRGKAATDAVVRDGASSDSHSRPGSAASGFLNGILTPPSGTGRRFGAGFGRSGTPAAEIPSKTLTIPQLTLSAKQVEKRPAPYTGRRPAYPIGTSGSQLFRRDNYDADADSSVLSGEFYDDGDDATETGGDYGEMEPFGTSPYSRS